MIRIALLHGVTIMAALLIGFALACGQASETPVNKVTLKVPEVRGG